MVLGHDLVVGDAQRADGNAGGRDHGAIEGFAFDHAFVAGLRGAHDQVAVPSVQRHATARAQQHKSDERYKLPAGGLEKLGVRHQIGRVPAILAPSVDVRAIHPEVHVAFHLLQCAGLVWKNRRVGSGRRRAQMLEVHPAVGRVAGIYVLHLDERRQHQVALGCVGQPGGVRQRDGAVHHIAYPARAATGQVDADPLFPARTGARGLRIDELAHAVRRQRATPPAMHVIGH